MGRALGSHDRDLFLKIVTGSESYFIKGSNWIAIFFCLNILSLNYDFFKVLKYHTCQLMQLNPWTHF